MTDCIAFAPHPDDAELFCSGLLLKMKKSQHSVAVIDLTAGELSSNGTVATRRMESQKASRILKLDFRENLKIPDGNIENTFDNRLKIIEVVRKNQPKLVLVPYWIDRHPDHVNASVLISDALFYAGLSKIKTDFKAYRPPKIIYYMLHLPFEPSFILDITQEFETKLESIQAYKSQFDSSLADSQQTYINKPDFIESLVARCKHYGALAGVKYGEPFLLKNILKIDNIDTLIS